MAGRHTDGIGRQGQPNGFKLAQACAHFKVRRSLTGSLSFDPPQSAPSPRTGQRRPRAADLGRVPRVAGSASGALVHWRVWNRKTGRQEGFGTGSTTGWDCIALSFGRGGLCHVSGRVLFGGAREPSSLGRRTAGAVGASHSCVGLSAKAVGVSSSCGTSRSGAVSVSCKSERRESCRRADRGRATLLLETIGPTSVRASVERPSRRNHGVFPSTCLR
jgi:hypothetical protein